MSSGATVDKNTGSGMKIVSTHDKMSNESPSGGHGADSRSGPPPEGEEGRDSGSIPGTSTANSGPRGGAPESAGEDDGRHHHHDDSKMEMEDHFADGDAFDDDEGKNDEGGGRERRKIEIKFIQNKARRHITFSKRKHGIMKKAWELSVLTGTQVLLLVVSETGLVYTFTTPKLQPLVTQSEGKNLIQACLNAADTPQDGESPNAGGPIGQQHDSDSEVSPQYNPSMESHKAQNAAQHHAQIVAMRKAQQLTKEVEVRPLALNNGMMAPQQGGMMHPPQGMPMMQQQPQQQKHGGQPGGQPPHLQPPHFQAKLSPNGVADGQSPQPADQAAAVHTAQHQVQAQQTQAQQQTQAIQNAQAQAMAVSGLPAHLQQLAAQGYKMPPQYGYAGYPFSPAAVGQQFSQQFGQMAAYPGQLAGPFDTVALLNFQQQQQQQQAQQQAAQAAQAGQPQQGQPGQQGPPSRQDGTYANGEYANGMPIPPQSLRIQPPGQPVMQPVQLPPAVQPLQHERPSS